MARGNPANNPVSRGVGRGAPNQQRWAAAPSERHPERLAGLSAWLGPIDARDGRLRTPQLDRSHGLATGLVGLRAGLFAGVRRGNVSLLAQSGRVSPHAHSALTDAVRGGLRRARPAAVSVSHTIGARSEWAAISHAVVRPRYTPVPAWAVLGPPRFTSGKTRNAFRQPTQTVKTMSLLRALAQGQQAVANAPAG